MASSRKTRVDACDNCGRPIDDCACRCPFGGEVEGGECGIGTEVAAGGDGR